MMKLLLGLVLLQSCHSFVLQPRNVVVVSAELGATRLQSAIVDLVPEPEGGQEMTARTTLPGCRMKQMEEMEAKGDDGPIYKFWMTAEVDGALFKEIRTQILKDASKKANFPGFRKGQVPPYAQPQITQFSMQESIIRTVEAAVAAFGLKSLKGSDGQVEVLEDVQEISRRYKIKSEESIQFTATLSAAYDPEKKPKMEEKKVGPEEDSVNDPENQPKMEEKEVVPVEDSVYDPEKQPKMEEKEVVPEEDFVNGLTSS